MLPQRKHICLSTQEEAAYFHSVLTSLSSGLIKMSKEIIRLCIYRMSSKILRVIYTCGPFTFSLFIPHVREAIHFPPEVEQKSQLSILVNLSHISSSSSTASLRKTWRGEKIVCWGFGFGRLQFCNRFLCCGGYFSYYNDICGCSLYRSMPAGFKWPCWDTHHEAVTLAQTAGKPDHLHIPSFWDGSAAKHSACCTPTNYCTESLGTSS